jgi:MiaB/RimO family radical SAM methylthiotransferase
LNALNNEVGVESIRTEMPRMDKQLKNGSQKVAIITNNVGCERHVQYYSTLEKYCASNKWEVVNSFDADKVLICACGFHDFMVEKVSKLLNQLRESKFPEKDIVIAGCLPKTHRSFLQKEFGGEIVEFNGERRLDAILNVKIPFESIPPVNVFLRPQDWPVRQDKTFFINIGQGCLDKCAYCVINKVKGRLQSVPVEEIKKQFASAVSQGFRDIYLIGEDTFAYGVDIGTNILQLIYSLLEISSDVSFTFGNWHIRWLPKYSEGILSLCKRGIVKRLSIGLQHVNETLLRRMGRPINFDEIYGILRRFREECPDLCLYADIMVGFPGETSEMFDQLIDFFRKDTVFNIISSFGYSDVQGARSSGFDGKVNSLRVGYRWATLRQTLGKRSSYNEIDESDPNRTAFLLSFEQDYSFCKDTYSRSTGY